MANKLANETSPYLLQHAQNPVDWYPWGEEALEKAKSEDKPILLSVGYSACHWCHVMERESFEDPQIAELMNAGFVCIKVDREERPDIDSIYMKAVQILTGSGGWPMTVFLTSDAKPFYGGTYFPPEDRHGIPGFPRVITSVLNAYKNERKGVSLNTEGLLDRIEMGSGVELGQEDLTADVLSAAFNGIAQDFDPKYGGVGLQPKFPQPMTYEFLLRYYLRFNDSQALNMVETTLDRMATGGIYDQIGGGFHRYSTDTYWLVPHFEKMLYDNALLARLYLHAFQVTGKPLYKRVVEEILDYVVREMTDVKGGFYSSQDADSEGEEGKFFVWRPEEIDEILGDQNGSLIRKYYGVTAVGNFEGHSILNVDAGSREELVQSGLSAQDIDSLISLAKTSLLSERQKRVSPDRDDKILTAWNGLMLAAFAEAGAVLDRDDYVKVASDSAAFLIKHLRNEGRLLRTHKDGKSKLLGYLEDYSFLIDGLLILHESSFDPFWLKTAVELGEEMISLFWDDNTEQFFDTGSDHEKLVVRPLDITDNAIPSGSSMATNVLLRLAILTGDADMNQRALNALKRAGQLMQKFPTGSGHWLCGLDFYLSKPKEIVIVGNRNDCQTRRLTTEIYRSFLPNRVVAGISDRSNTYSESPLTRNREKLDNQPTAYVCERYVCQIPVNDPNVFASHLVT